MLYTPYVWPMAVAGLAMSGIAAYVLKYKSVPASRPHAAMMASGAAWAFSYALAVSVPDRDARILLGNCSLLFVLGASTSVIAMVLELTGLCRRLPKRWILPLAAVPLAFAGIVATSRAHPWFRTDFHVDLTGGFSSLHFTAGPLYAAYVCYLTFATIGAVALLVALSLRDREEIAASLLISLGILLPLAASTLYALGLSPLRGIDMGPMTLVLTGILTGIALFGGRFLDMTHMARGIVLDNLADLVVVLDSGGRVADLNRAAKEALGLAGGRFAGKGIAELPGAWAEILARHPIGAAAREEAAVGRGREERCFDLTVTPIVDGKGRVHGSVYLFHEITTRKRLEEELRASKALYGGIVERQTDPISRWLPDTTLTFVNDAYCRYFGQRREDLIGRPFRPDLHPDTDRAIQATIATLLEGRIDTISAEEINLDAGGEPRWMVWAYSTIKDAAGRVVELQSVGRDITDRTKAERDLRAANEALADQLARNKELQARLLEQAVRDELTGLFNRRYLQETLGREIAGALRGRHPISIVMLDLDHFKQVNDTYGHEAGDAILAAVGRTLLANTRQMDIACRYGGEEFVVILPTTPAERAGERAESLRRAVSELVVDYEGRALRITISGGVAAFPDHGDDGESTLKAADKAMYEAKAAGRDRIVVKGKRA